MTVLADYSDLSEATRRNLDAIAEFIADMDGKDIVVWKDEDHCIDDGTVDAENAVKAFNEMVECFRKLEARPS